MINMESKYIYSIFIIIIILILSYYSKSNFYNLEKEQVNIRPLVFTNETVPAKINNDVLTRSDIERLFKEITVFANGPPNGANVNVTQNKYDLLFKDIIISSEKRNKTKYPNPNKYSMELNLNMDKIYKAELVDVYIPAATDITVNIPTCGNRLYFTYTNYCEDFTAMTTTGYVIIQAGTYLSPENIAEELTRQFYIVLMSAGFTVTKTVGVTVVYNKNLNRYIFKDRSFNINSEFLPTLIIYSKNGYVINMDLTVKDSITDSLLLNQDVYHSGPKMINSLNGVLYVDTGTDYGEYLNDCNDMQDVAPNVDSQFSNCIISEVVLTQCKIFLSLGKLNGTTCNIIPDQSGGDKNIPFIFCQVPNNSCVSSSAVKTLSGETNSLIQFYNPPISKVNRFDIRWYSEDGHLLRILDHCFTIRIYYFQKRLDTTDFSYPIL
jgi:hypothetical protein